MHSGVQHHVQTNIWHNKLPSHLHMRHTDWQKNKLTKDKDRLIQTIWLRAKQSDRKIVADRLKDRSKNNKWHRVTKLLRMGGQGPHSHPHSPHTLLHTHKVTKEASKMCAFAIFTSITMTDRQMDGQTNGQTNKVSCSIMLHVCN